MTRSGCANEAVVGLQEEVGVVFEVQGDGIVDEETTAEVVVGA